MQSTADAIHDALTMDAETKKSNHDKLWKVSGERGMDRCDCPGTDSPLYLVYSTSRLIPVKSGEPTLSLSVSPYLIQGVMYRR